MEPLTLTTPDSLDTILVGHETNSDTEPTQGQELARTGKKVGFGDKIEFEKAIEATLSREITFHFL